MKPAKFKYAAAETLEEAISLLDEYGDEAKVLAGGQSIIPLMNLRLARPAVLVDINRISKLDGVQRNAGLAVGAITRQTTALGSDEVRSYAPIVPAALRYVGHPGIRTRGTFGGSIAHADPAAELPVVALALGAEVTVQGPSGERTISADDLFLSNFTTSLAANEILTRVRFPNPIDQGHWSFHEVARRYGDFALVAVAVVAESDGSGNVRQARIALGGVADRLVRLQRAEQALVGQPLGNASSADEAGRLAAEDLDPPSDVHATSAYRKRVGGALVTRAATDMTIQR